MTHVLATVLISLAIPALALGVIVALERHRREPLDQIPGVPQMQQAETAGATVDRAAVMVDSAAAEPAYRKRVG